MAGVLRRARISNAARVRAVLIPACGVGMWLQGSQSATSLEPLAVGSTLHQSGADALVSGPPNEFGEGPLASGLAVGPTGPTGFATAYATSYSCAFEFQPCDLGGFSGVSCASETSCTAVGTAVGNASLAEGWGGTKWTIEPTPAPSDATYSTLASVSCVIPTKCLAVGSYYGSSGELPLAELWNGSSWTIRPPPSPPEASYSVLSYVQCASTEECMAVGSYYSTTTSQTVPLAELWDGSAWTIQSVPLPSGAESGSLTGVSCPAEATCSSVGAYSTPGTGQMPLAEAWDGTNWTIQSTAIPAGSSSSALHAVWCESAKSCSAVGINASSSGGSLTLAESWDGTSWTIEPTPNPNASSYNGFTNLSCAPEGKPCTAVGFSGNATLTESWDGMTWGELPITPEPAGSTQSSFSDVSCTAPNVCTAVGQYLDSTEGPTGAYLTLAERWNGTSWTIQPTANPALAGTDAATNITSSTADLHGTVYPGGAATTCYFEYGTTSAYGSTIPCAQTTGPGAAPVSVSANLAGLSPNTTYNFNLVATNAGGGMTYTPSPASSFTTLATSGGSPGGGTGSSGTGGGSSTGTTPPGGSSGGGGGTSPCVSGPGNPPRAVVILLTGIDSQLPYSESYNPLTQSYCGLYSTLNPSLADLSEMAIQAFDSSSDGQIQPVNLTDALAESGALLLPFSYNGSTLSGSSTNPTYSVQSFGENVPGERLPDVEADTYLLQLVNQVHGLWKNTPIFVIGHSNGGLIAEQLFERHSVNELAGVARIVSLDSPINGLGIPLGVSTPVLV